MNSNKALNSTKAMWQAANRNAADSNTKPETFFEAKNMKVGIIAELIKVKNVSLIETE